MVVLVIKTLVVSEIFSECSHRAYLIIIHLRMRRLSQNFKERTDKLSDIIIGNR